MATADQSFQVILDARVIGTRKAAGSVGKKELSGAVQASDGSLTKILSGKDTILVRTTKFADIVQ